MKQPRSVRTIPQAIVPCKLQMFISSRTMLAWQPGGHQLIFALHTQQRLGPGMACESQGSPSRATFLPGSPEAHVCPAGSRLMACKTQAFPSSAAFLQGAIM